MSEQVPGQVALSDEYAEWRAADAFDAAREEFRKATANMTEDEVATEVKQIVDEVRAERDDLPDEVAEEERGLITVARPQSSDHHVITGMAALARMDDAEYENAIAIVTRGIERVKDFQQRAMTKGEDYGVVKGIDRPFLHLPGAEKLCLLYGLAARQEADRLVGRRAVQKVGEVETETGEWLSAPLAYHVRTYIHLGSFDGPIVAMGYGEASSWEPKYRYIFAKAVCPKCGREGLIRGKEDGKLKGKWWCPGREGGCNNTFERADPAVTPPGKIDNPDPAGLAETLLQMAAKRSFVAATRRATGTSGLFTQDEDSPSVQAQAEPESGHEDAPPTIEPVTDGTTVARGGKADQPTPTQIAMLSRISKDKDLGPDRIASAINILGLGTPELGEGDRTAKGLALLAFIKSSLTADDLGSLLHTLETGEIEATPGFPPQQSDEM